MGVYTTANYAFEAPDGADPISQGDNRMRTLADQVDAALLGLAADPIPEYTTTQRNALSPTNGMLIYNTTDSKFQVRVGGAWVNVRIEGTAVVRQTWVYTLPGDIKVPSGQTDFLPLSPVSVGSGETVVAVAYQWILSYGTSFTFTLNKRSGATLGTTTALATGIVATSSAVKGQATLAGSLSDRTFADGDAWVPVITAVSGSPAHGAIGLVVDITV